MRPILWAIPMVLIAGCVETSDPGLCPIPIASMDLTLTGFDTSPLRAHLFLTTEPYTVQLSCVPPATNNRLSVADAGHLQGNVWTTHWDGVTIEFPDANLTINATISTSVPSNWVLSDGSEGLRLYKDGAAIPIESSAWTRRDETY